MRYPLIVVIFYYIYQVYSVLRLSAAEFMQNLFPSGGGPSVKTWPRCAPQRAQSTSSRIIPADRSTWIVIFCSETALLKLGHPVPESNLSSERKRSMPQQAQAYTPSAWQSWYLPENGASVPLIRATSKVSGSRTAFHSLSVFSTGCISISLPSRTE